MSERESKDLVAKREPQNAVRRLESNPLLLASEHWNRLRQICDDAVKSGLLPKSVDTPQKAFIIALKGNEFGFSPLYALEQLAVVNGKVTISGQAMLRLIFERVPGAVVSFVTPVERQNTECEVVMARPGQAKQRFKFTIEDAERAGLLNKPGPWKQYQRIMLRWRVVSEGARVVFPDAIAGLYLSEEMGGEVAPSDVVEVEYSRLPEPEVAASASHPTNEKPVASGEAVADGSRPVGPSANSSSLTEKQIKRLFAISKQAGWSVQAVKTFMRANFKKEHSKELSWVEYEKLCQAIERNPLTALADLPAATEFAPSADERFPFEKQNGDHQNQ